MPNGVHATRDAPACFWVVAPGPRGRHGAVAALFFGLHPDRRGRQGAQERAAKMCMISRPGCLFLLLTLLLAFRHGSLCFVVGLVCCFCFAGLASCLLLLLLLFFFVMLLVLVALLALLFVCGAALSVVFVVCCCCVPSVLLVLYVVCCCCRCCFSLMLVMLLVLVVLLLALLFVCGAAPKSGSGLACRAVCFFVFTLAC